MGQWWLTMTAEDYMQCVEARREANASPWSLRDLEWQSKDRIVRVGPPLFPRISKSLDKRK